ncbi:MAG: carboxy terminal-processing peptidase, partial [Opitutales bacterium]
ALQDHDRAIIVGDKATHGKGTVQSMIEMNVPPYLYETKGNKRSAAKITIQKYYLPSGNSTQNDGVTADVKMKSINNFLPIGESDLPNALESDKIPAVVSRRGSNDFVIAKGSIAHLDKLSLKRQESLPEFKHLHTNIDWYKGKREQKSFSLNLKDRLKQKKDDDAYNEEMKAEMKTLAVGAYSSQPVKLDVVLDLERRSNEAREKVDEEKVDSKPSVIDIRLREGLRIMSDWIRWKAELTGKTAEKATPVKES